MKAPPPQKKKTVWANIFSNMQNLLQHNEMYEALFITGVAFYLPLRSSNYFSIMKKRKFSTSDTSLQKIYTATSSISEHHHLYYIHREVFI